jgi:hypothetical protein
MPHIPVACKSRGALPTRCQTEPPWSIDALRAAVPSFVEVYQGRPQRDTEEYAASRMLVNHAFALWFTVRQLQPTAVIESGVYHGQGTYMIRHAGGPALRIFSLDPELLDKSYAVLDGGRRNTSKASRARPFRDPNLNTTYFLGSGNRRAHRFRDFADLDWDALLPRGEQRLGALVVLDDHMSAVKRVRQALRLGFRHLWYDDNWARGSVDCYSFNLMCSPLRAPPRRPGPAPATQGVVYLDNFARVRKRISVAEHEANLAFLRAHTEVYYEFPPLAEACRVDVAGSNSQRTAVLASTDELVRVLSGRGTQVVFQTRRFVSYYPPYVRLRAGPVDQALLEATTAYSLEQHHNPACRGQGSGWCVDLEWDRATRATRVAAARKHGFGF